MLLVKEVTSPDSVMSFLLSTPVPGDVGAGGQGDGRAILVSGFKVGHCC